jgi:hypothetical protein
MNSPRRNFINIDQGYHSTSLTQGVGKSSTNATPRTGDQGNPPVQLESIQNRRGLQHFICHDSFPSHLNGL